MKPTFSKYLGILLSPFWRWWWAAITGIASIIALFGTPDSGVMLSKVSIFIITFIALTIIFFLISIIQQGWLLYCERHRGLEVVSIVRTRDFESVWIFIISGYLHEINGSLIEIRRPLDDTEVPFAIVRVLGRTDRGYYQAVPIWISAGHLRDFTRHEFNPRILIATPIVNYDRLREAFRE